MKKIFVLLVTITALMSCSKDDDNSFHYDKSLLHGTWRITSVQGRDGSWTDVTKYPGSTVMSPTYATFHPNGNYYGEGYFGTGEGTYRTKGNQVITYVDKEEYIRYTIISLLSNTCELNMSMTGSTSTMTIRCTKQ